MSSVNLASHRVHGRQQPADEIEREEPDRHVDEEDPVPGEVVGQEAAQERADQEGDTEDGAEQALILAAFGRREQVAYDRQRDREESACAETLTPRKRISCHMVWLSPESTEQRGRG